MSLLKPNLLVSKLMMNCCSASFLCLLSLQALKSLMLWSSALKYNGRGRSTYCLIECVSETSACFSYVLCFLAFLATN